MAGSAEKILLFLCLQLKDETGRASEPQTWNKLKDAAYQRAKTLAEAVLNAFQVGPNHRSSQLTTRFAKASACCRILCQVGTSMSRSRIRSAGYSAEEYADNTSAVVGNLCESTVALTGKLRPN